MKKFLPILGLLLVSMSCVDRYQIPDTINHDSGTIGAGDTTYLQLNPIWDATYGIENPVEISIAQDGRIFIADSSQQSILVFDQNGNSPEGFDGLQNLRNESGYPIEPIDVDIDKKMNVFFIDGSDHVYVWNQYWNTVGISNVISQGTFIHDETGATQMDTVGTDTWLTMLNDNEWTLTNPVFTNDESIILSLLNPHLFFDGSNELNDYLDPHYQTDMSVFSGLTAPADQDNYIYVTDNYGGINNQYRLVQIDFQKSHLLELSNGEFVWAFTGQFGSNVKGYGTGAGTVNKPLSLDVDYSGNLYYTQVGDYFKAHKLIPNLSGDFATYSSGFQPFSDEILDEDRLMNPMDIALDNSKNIYVADQADATISVFDAHGQFFKKAGIQSNEDTLSVLKSPVAVAVDNRGVVYVCDSEDGTVIRFKLSNALDEDIQPED